MKRSELKQIIREVIEEAKLTGLLSDADMTKLYGMDLEAGKEFVQKKLDAAKGMKPENKDKVQTIIDSATSLKNFQKRITDFVFAGNNLKNI